MDKKTLKIKKKNYKGIPNFRKEFNQKKKL